MKLDNRVADLDEEMHAPAPEEETPPPAEALERIVAPPVVSKKPGEAVSADDINNLQSQISKMFD